MHFSFFMVVVFVVVVRFCFVCFLLFVLVCCVVFVRLVFGVDFVVYIRIWGLHFWGLVC